MVKKICVIRDFINSTFSCRILICFVFDRFGFARSGLARLHLLDDFDHLITPDSLFFPVVGSRWVRWWFCVVPRSCEQQPSLPQLYLVVGVHMPTWANLRCPICWLDSRPSPTLSSPVRTSNNCFDPSRPLDHKLKLPRPYTVTGLALWLDTTRQTLLNYEDRADFLDTIAAAKLKIENFGSERLFDAGTPTRGVIFSLSNNSQGWTEKSEVTSKSIDQLIKDQESSPMNEGTGS